MFTVGSLFAEIGRLREDNETLKRLTCTPNEYLAKIDTLQREVAAVKETLLVVRAQQKDDTVKPSVTELKHALAAKDDELEKRCTYIAEQDHEMDLLKDQLAAKDEQVKGAESAREHYAQLLAKATAQLAAKEAELATAKATSYLHDPKTALERDTLQAELARLVEGLRGALVGIRPFMGATESFSCPCKRCEAIRKVEAALGAGEQG